MRASPIHVEKQDIVPTWSPITNVLVFVDTVDEIALQVMFCIPYFVLKLLDFRNSRTD